MLKPTKSKSAPTMIEQKPKQKGTIVLDKFELEEAGFEVRFDDDRVTVFPTRVASNEQIEAGRDFARTLGLSDSQTEELLEFGFDLAIWARFRSVVQS